MNSRPYAESCDRNREPILEVIRPLLADKHNVLEIGSGTGQHAIYFAQQMQHLHWYTSDRLDNHAGIHMWLAEANLNNVQPPIELDVTHSAWPELEIDAVFTANTTHIMHWPDVQAMFKGIGELLRSGGLFMQYGPFSYGGEHTSESNAAFDQRLKEGDPGKGIRDFNELRALADSVGLVLQDDYAMPANNRILVWRKE